MGVNVFMCPVIRTICCSHPDKRWWSFKYEDTNAASLLTSTDEILHLSSFSLLIILLLICFQHLHAKGRKDDLFSDPCYQQFGEELNKVLKDWQPSLLPDGESGNIHPAPQSSVVLNYVLILVCLSLNFYIIWPCLLWGKIIMFLIIIKKKGGETKI